MTLSCESILTFDLTQPTPLIIDLTSLNDYNGYDIVVMDITMVQ